MPNTLSSINDEPLAVTLQLKNGKIGRMGSFLLRA